MLEDRLWVFFPGPYPPKRDPHADDPDYYYRSREGWIKKTVWTVENEPLCTDREVYTRFLDETTEEERQEIRAERRRRHNQEQLARGLVRWQDRWWVTPERRDELRKEYDENMRQSQRGLALARQMRDDPFMQGMWR